MMKDGPDVGLWGALGLVEDEEDDEMLLQQALEASMKSYDVDTSNDGKQPHSSASSSSSSSSYYWTEKQRPHSPLAPLLVPPSIDTATIAVARGYFDDNDEEMDEDLLKAIEESLR